MRAYPAASEGGTLISVMFIPFVLHITVEFEHPKHQYSHFRRQRLRPSEIKLFAQGHTDVEP